MPFKNHQWLKWIANQLPKCFIKAILGARLCSEQYVRLIDEQKKPARSCRSLCHANIYDFSPTRMGKAAHRAYICCRGEKKERKKPPTFSNKMEPKSFSKSLLKKTTPMYVACLNMTECFGFCGMFFTAVDVDRKPGSDHFNMR